jgi:hypothetical protein
MTVHNTNLTMLELLTIRVALDGMLMLGRKTRRSARAGSRLHREASESIVAVETLLAKLPQVSMCDAMARQALAEGYEAATATRN